MADLLTNLQSLGFSPKKISNTEGGEYSSGCPGCGDGGKGSESDRFHIWPEKAQKLCRGRYWCRQCDTSGDTIKFMQKFMNMSFREACMDLGVILPNSGGTGRKRFQPSAALPVSGPGWQPRSYPYPEKLWQEKASALLANCQECLQASPEYLSFLEKRGITAAMAASYGLGYNVSSKGGDRYRPRKSWGLADKGGKKKLWLPQGWVVPAYDADGNLLQLRVRRRAEDIETFCHNIKYYPVDGSSMATMVLHPSADVFVPVECGFDAILIAGLLDGKVGAITTWNASARPDLMAHKILSRASLILNGLDYDKAGEKEQGWWNTTYKQNRRLVQPQSGVGDPGEAFAAGVDIRAWVLNSLPSGLKIKLGVDKKKAPVVVSQPKVAPAEKTERLADKQEPPVVIEISLSNGKVIYVTDDQQEWKSLSAQHKPVFSRNELERLQVATSSMNDADRLAAAMQAIEVKELFGGYINRGQSFD